MNSKSCFPASIPPEAALLRALIVRFPLRHGPREAKVVVRKAEWIASRWTGEWMAMHSDVISKMPQSVQPLGAAKSYIILNPPLHTNPRLLSLVNPQVISGILSATPFIIASDEDPARGVPQHSCHLPPLRRNGLDSERRWQSRVEGKSLLLEVVLNYPNPVEKQLRKTCVCVECGRSQET